jgi:tetratricopeptide (TPR) repeat protein
VNQAQKFAEGLRLHQAGQFPQAQKIYAEILEAEPKNADALHYMGILALQGQAPEQAETLIKQAVAALPDYAEAYNNLGFVQSQLGKIEDAIASYRRAVEIMPGYGEAFYNLGNALSEARRFEEARESLDAACRAMPTHAPSHNNLADALRELGRLEDAAEHLRRALEIDPDYALAHYNLGNVARLLDQPDEALAHYQRALELKPDDAQAAANIGNLVMERGDGGEAERWYDKALAIDPGDAETYRFLSRVHRFDAADPLIGRMAGLMAQDNVTDAKAMHLGYALAKAYEDLGRYDEAFAMLERANGIMRSSLEYTIERDETVADEIIRCVDADFLAARAGSGDAGAAPIFVTGMPRSGSTLVEQILAAHPAVYGAGEVDFLRTALLDGFQPQRGETLADFLNAQSGGDFAHRGAAYQQKFSGRDAGTARNADKNLFNFWHIGLIPLMLPEARVVHCVRDPLDCCVSIYKTYFVGNLPFSYDLTELGRYYRIYDRLMTHWRSLLPDFVYELSYEALVGDQEGESRRLLEFCGLDWDDAVLDYRTAERSVITASAAQVREPIYASSIGSWRRFDAHLGPLIEALGPLAKS